MDLREADVNTNYVFDIDRTIAGQQRLPGCPTRAGLSHPTGDAGTVSARLTALRRSSCEHSLLRVSPAPAFLEIGKRRSVLPRIDSVVKK
jgi:hypothetical protein